MKKATIQTIYKGKQSVSVWLVRDKEEARVLTRKLKGLLIKLEVMR